MTPATRVVVLDFEATCTETGAPDPQEIIELPSVLVDLSTRAVVDAFEAFVRPIRHPTLSAFCTGLTSITQADVDDAPTFPEVFAAHQRWLRGHGLRVDTDDAGDEVLFVTCGDWDLATMLPNQLAACDPPIVHVPRAYRTWCNLKRPFLGWRGAHGSTSLPGMLEALGLTFEGRHHRGIDDCRNTARIATELVERGVALEPTSALSRSRYAPVALTLVRGEQVARIVLRRRTMAGLLGLASGAFRRTATVAWDEGGRVLDADTVLDLREGQRITVA